MVRVMRKLSWLTHVKPIHPKAPHSISPRMAGFEHEVGKYAKKLG